MDDDRSFGPTRVLNNRRTHPPSPSLPSFQTGPVRRDFSTTVGPFGAYRRWTCISGLLRRKRANPCNLERTCVRMPLTRNDASIPFDAIRPTICVCFSCRRTQQVHRICGLVIVDNAQKKRKRSEGGTLVRYTYQIVIAHPVTSISVPFKMEGIVINCD